MAGESLNDVMWWIGLVQVTRSKNRWKCVLKDGIVKLNGKDLLFVKVRTVSCPLFLLCLLFGV